MIPLITSTTLTILLLITKTNTQMGDNSNPNKGNDAMESEYQRLVDKLIPKIRPFGSPSSSISSTTTTITTSASTDIPPFSQYWIGVAGGPGSGKTTTTARVAQRLNDLYKKKMTTTTTTTDPSSSSKDGGQKSDVAIVIPMDGWHTPQKELIRKFGIYGMRRRGAPDTFDVEQMINDLRKAKQQGYGTFPVYSREISDPVLYSDDDENGYGCRLHHHHSIVFVEGLYMLMQDDPAWEPLAELWDEQWYIEAPSRDIQIERLIRRSLKTWNMKKIDLWGPGWSGARRKVETIDIPNMDLVEPSKRFANEVIITR